MSAFDKYPDLLSPGFIEEYDLAGGWTSTHPDREYEEKDVAVAIVLFNGNYSKIAVALGRSRSSVENYIARNSLLRHLREEVHAAIIDDIEHGYMQAALNGDNAARKFFLTTKGKDRGYGGTGESDEERVKAPVIDMTKLSDEAILEILSAKEAPKRIA